MFNIPKPYLLMLLIVSAGVMSGCATKSDSPAQTAFVDTFVAPVPYERAWLVTRDVLLESDVEIHTRDKQGIFVVYTDMYRRKLVVPHRTKLTVTLESAGDDSTRISVESIHQKYGVSLLTHPEWRDQSVVNVDSAGADLLNSIKSSIAIN